MTVRHTTDYIVIHCAATRAAMDVGVKEIRQWHKQRGWSDIGYHFVIRRNGKIERGRAENQVGAHVANHNHNTIGVCLVGGLGEGKGWPPENNFTEAQWAALRTLCVSLIGRYPGATILGHRDFPYVGKACPSFDARAWARGNGLPAAPPLKKMGPQALIGSGGVGAGGVLVEDASSTLADNSDSFAPMLDMAQERFAGLAANFSWAGTALKLIGIALLAYAAWRAACWLWGRLKTKEMEAEQ